MDWLWSTVRLFVPAVVVGGLYYWVAATQGLPNFAFLVGLSFIIALLSLEGSIMQLWRRKADKPRDEYEE